MEGAHTSEGKRKNRSTFKGNHLWLQMSASSQIDNETVAVKLSCSCLSFVGTVCMYMCSWVVFEHGAAIERVI